MALINCEECGYEFSDKAAMCPKCGAPSEFRERPQNVFIRQEHKRLTAMWLALFLGGIGVHKMYLGKIGQATLYLLFCWTWIPLIISVFEGFGFMAMSDADFDREYNK